MVGAADIIREFGIPRGSLYWLINEGRIPAHDVTKPWHRTRRLGFKRSEVRDALARMERERPER